jgi:hypothetical protein
MRKKTAVLLDFLIAKRRKPRFVAEKPMNPAASGKNKGCGTLGSHHPSTFEHVRKCPEFAG